MEKISKGQRNILIGICFLFVLLIILGFVFRNSYALSDDGLIMFMDEVVVDNDNMVIRTTIPLVTYGDIIKEVNMEDGYVLLIDADNEELSREDIVKTGDIVRVVKGNMVDEYKVVLLGDVNGDGMVNSLDVINIIKLINGSVVKEIEVDLSQDVNYLYGDVNNDGVVDYEDLVSLREYLSLENSVSDKFTCPGVISCDVNLDGVVNGDDEFILEGYINGSGNYKEVSDGDPFMAAMDITGNGIVDMDDIIKINSVIR